MRRIVTFILPLILMFTVGAISAQDAPRVVASTTILADVAQNVAGDHFMVSALIPADTDPHAFEPSTAEAALVADADLLLTVGAGYEAFLADLLETVGGAVPVVVASDGIEILPYGAHEDHEEAHEEEHAEGEVHATEEPHAEGEAHAEDEHHDEHLGVLGDDLECEAHAHDDDEAHTEESNEGDSHEGEVHEHGDCDAHVWHDVANVIVWSNNLAEAFAALDPANADSYRANAAAYVAQLETLDGEIRDAVSTIPEERRVLITNHEFMGYYAHAYGFEVAATVLPGNLTGSEIAPQDLAALIELVRAEGVPAIFAENTTNPQLAELIAQEAGVSVVTRLYSDALGADAPTYIDLMRANTQTLVDALN